MKGRTRVNHPPEAALPADNRPLVAPIHQTVKFAFENLEETMRAYRGEREGYYYTRRANPTTRQLEKLLAELQGRDDCVAFGSGMAAVAGCLLSLTRAGEHVLCFVETYTPSRQLIQGLLGRFGVEHTMLSVEDDAGIERVLAERPTRLVWFESPTNPVTRIADIGRITRAAHAHGALTLLDNTFAGFHNHGQYGIDIYVHSLTKYASGHGDVMGGAIIARDELIRGIRRDAVLLGALLDPHAAFLVMRGMKTYYLRHEAQAASAARIAGFLAGHAAVASVNYPGLPGHPRHALAREQMHDFGSIVTFNLEGGLEAARVFADTLEFFAITPSLGSVESLVMPAQLLRPRGLTKEQAAISGITDGTVRLSIGIEDCDDLIADLDAALSRVSEA
ncbi:MAG: aminotransferase class I/II-fold pyridoxal phosphate-dependent enzyme [Gammaproteobacteria bacterium]|nr:aminotransferase class I/II-fold pyridoxal phosphate-dependent enzyme [Gammaproteobacteria bacterium]